MKATRIALGLGVLAAGWTVGCMSPPPEQASYPVSVRREGAGFVASAPAQTPPVPVGSLLIGLEARSADGRLPENATLTVKWTSTPPTSTSEAEVAGRKYPVRCDVRSVNDDLLKPIVDERWSVELPMPVLRETRGQLVCAFNGKPRGLIVRLREGYVQSLVRAAEEGAAKLAR